MCQVDVERLSPSYQFRLAKYAERGFEVYDDSLQPGFRTKIDPQLVRTRFTRVCEISTCL